MEHEIQHFLHPDHPLILIDLKDANTRWLIIETQKELAFLMRGSNRKDLSHDADEDSGKVNHGSLSCNGCDCEISDSAYSCIGCDIHLHKLCAKLPAQMTMKHPYHNPDHPLTLCYSSKYLRCAVCDRIVRGFTYRCDACNFYVDIRCASEVQVIDFKSHHHPLRPILSPALFKCDACATQHTAGFSYKCDTCCLWVHEDCAASPTVVKYNRHVHPLLLVTSFRDSEYGLERWCNICHCSIELKHHWYYECEGCHHRVHVNCITAPQDDEKIDEDIDMAKLFILPESFQYYELVGLFIKHMTHYRNKEETVVQEARPLTHFSHNHPLNLCNLQCTRLCNGCVLPISTPHYYSCNVCNNYFLHRWCAEIPMELKYPLQNRQEIFNWTTPSLYSWACFECDRKINGFLYQYNKDDWGWSMEMDINCLCVPPAILHKAHKHPLKLLQNCSDEGCVACPRQSREFAYGCEKCCFYLHSSCALQPIKIMHRYDKHPFILIQEPIEDGPEEYVCEFCEEDIDPNWWFYHCLYCDQSACAQCIFQKNK